MTTDDSCKARGIAWYDNIAQHVRDLRDDGEGDEGTLWVVLLLEGDRIGMAFAITAIPPELTEADAEGFFDGLAHVIDDVDPPGILFAVTRHDGEPRPIDWRVWESMRGRLAVARSELVDLTVVGDHSWWAVQAGRRDFAA